MPCAGRFSEDQRLAKKGVFLGCGGEGDLEAFAPRVGGAAYLIQKPRIKRIARASPSNPPSKHWPMPAATRLLGFMDAPQMEPVWASWLHTNWSHSLSPGLLLHSGGKKEPKAALFSGKKKRRGFGNFRKRVVDRIHPDPRGSVLPVQEAGRLEPRLQPGFSPAWQPPAQVAMRHK